HEELWYVAGRGRSFDRRRVDRCLPREETIAGQFLAGGAYLRNDQSGCRGAARRKEGNVRRSEDGDHQFPRGESVLETGIPEGMGIMTVAAANSSGWNAK